MQLLDVNILVHAHRRDAAHHERCRRLLDEPPPSALFGLTMPVVNGFLRLVTHPNLLKPATPLPLALQTVTGWAERPCVQWIAPGDQHFALFRSLCTRYQASGGAFYDLHLAALAIEHNAELVSLDQGFGRIHELRWRSPVAGLAG